MRTSSVTIAPSARAGDARPVAAVDDGVRQHEQKVAGARRAVAKIGGDEFLDQRPTFGPTPASEVIGTNSGSSREGRMMSAYVATAAAQG